MKELALLKITISIALSVGAFGLVLYVSPFGKSKVAATVSEGSITTGFLTCFNWSSPTKMFGCDPKTENGITGRYIAVNALAGTPFVLSIAKDSKGHIESSAGVASTITDPTGTFALRVAATKQIYSKTPVKGGRISNEKVWENIRGLNSTSQPLSLKANKSGSPFLDKDFINQWLLETRQYQSHTASIR